MAELETLRSLIQGGFKAWWDTQVTVPFDQGGFGYFELGSRKEGDDRVTALKIQKDDYRNNCSNFLISEADLQMHFGSFLFNHLNVARRYDASLPRYSVHLELGCYLNGGSAADVVVFEVDSSFSHSQKKLWSNARAIIEIKNENLMDRGYNFPGTVVDDIKKFARSNRSRHLHDGPILNFMMILDEDAEKGRGLEALIRKALDEALNGAEAPEFEFLIPKWPAT